MRAFAVLLFKAMPGWAGHLKKRGDHRISLAMTKTHGFKHLARCGPSCPVAQGLEATSSVEIQGHTDRTLQQLDQLGVHVPVLVGDVEHMNGLVVQQAGELGDKA